MKKLFLLFSMLLFSSLAFAKLENLTGGKEFIPWLWQEQLQPTIENSFDKKGFSILIAGGAATAISHQYDDRIRLHNLDPEARRFDKDTANLGGYLGSGGPGIGIAIAQLYLDPANGLQHSRALALTAASHITLASIISRQRPNGRDYLSMPSGHASSSFATATSLAYSYGWEVGIPAYLAATFVAATRVSENIHWLSDTVAAAALGIYWGRASALVSTNGAAERQGGPLIMPIPTADGGIVAASWEF